MESAVMVEQNNEGDGVGVRVGYTPLISQGLYKFKDNFILADKNEIKRDVCEG